MENLEMNAQVEETAVEQTTATESAKKSSAKDFFVKVGKGVKEFFRRFMVSLKRRPHNIALVMLIVTFVVYSFNLTNISNTTAYIYGSGMGLCEFAAMLFSVLAIVCFLNAFPKRQKAKIIMVILLFAMLALIIFCDIMYYVRIVQAVLGENPTKDMVGDHVYVAKAMTIMIVHIIMLAVSVLLIATIPLYGKLFKKIKTSIDVEYTEADEEVELAEEA